MRYESCYLKMILTNIPLFKIIIIIQGDTEKKKEKEEKKQLFSG